MKTAKLKKGKALVAELKPIKMALVTMKENPAWKKQMAKIMSECRKLNKIPCLIVKSVH